MFSFFNIFAPFKPVCFEAVIEVDVMHNYVSFLDFFIPQNHSQQLPIQIKKVGFLLKRLEKIKEKISPGNFRMSKF